ncbi:TPA: YraN family protein [Klebsiella variicola]|uniref:YraN family protein n=1 Tax=Klebsiella variicola TaxID=244366 RepID=UPI0010330F7C|nr:YraN family protein [Klebsiella variicola]HBX9977676.1 YraN family protein [Klebsiella variicola]
MAQVPAGKNRSGQLSKQTGDAWENQARRWLEGQGLRFIAANARERGGEIDLIMRGSARYGDAAASVTPQKQQRLLKAARLWLCRQNGSFETVDCRFDVVAFTGNDIQWLKNAFGE